MNIPTSGDGGKPTRKRYEYEDNRAEKRPRPIPRSKTRKPRLADPGVTPATFYLPDGIDDILGRFDPGDRDAVSYLVHFVRWKKIMRQADEDGWSRLKTDYLRNVIGRDRRDLLTTAKIRLQQRGVIEVDRSMIRGEQCHGYRITDEWVCRDWRHRTCLDAGINQRIASHIEDDTADFQPVHHWLRDNLARVKIDLPRCRSIMSTLMPRKPLKTKTLAVYRAEQMQVAYQVDFDPAAGCFPCRYGRFHSLVTSLKKQLRPCLSVDGQCLVELDIKNSQPLFLGLVAREHHRGGVWRSRLLARSYHGDASPYRYQTCPPTGSDGIEEYIRLCESGLFYESLMDDPADKEERDRLKTDVFTECFFGANRSRKPRPIRTRFARRFPEVLRVLTDLKRRDYQRSAWILQSAESTLCVERICGRIMEERPDVPVVTVHDSWLCLPSDVAYVRSVILEEFARCGLTPKIDVK